MHPSRCLSSNGESSTLAECPVEPTCPEAAVSRVRTRRISCRVVYVTTAAGQGYCSPVRPMRTPHSPTARRRPADATRAAGSGDTHSTRQLRVERALTAATPPQQLSLLLEYSREGLRPKSGVPERAVPSRVLRAQMRVGARTHTTADRARVLPPGRWLARGIMARAARTGLAHGAGRSGKRANGSHARQAARQRQSAGGRRRGASRNSAVGGDARVVRGVGRAGALRFESEPAANQRIAPSRAANGQTVGARGALRGSSSAAVGARGRARAQASGSGARVTRGFGRGRALRFERVPVANKRGPGWAGLGRAPVRAAAGRRGGISLASQSGAKRGGGQSKRARKGVQGRGRALGAFRWFEGWVEGWLGCNARG